MQIVQYGEKYSVPCVLLLGYFDGMHVGHRALVAKAKQVAQKLGCAVGIMTFTQSKKGGQIYLFEERLHIFSSLGIDFVLAAQFDEKFKSTSPQEFLQTLCSCLCVRAFVCGEDFTFGKDAQGNVSLLQEFSKANNISVFVEKLVDFGGEKAAATLAKKYLDEGDVRSLSKLLGGKYFVFGTVSTEGRHIGRRMGFPTANIHLSAEKYPLKRAVYAVSAELDKKMYRGIANYGARPTFGDGRVVLEAYFDGYKGDLYGREITVYFDDFLREIKKFDSAEALSAQLTKDLEKIR